MCIKYTQRKKYCNKNSNKAKYNVFTAFLRSKSVTPAFADFGDNFLDLLKHKYHNEFTDSILNACKDFKKVCTKKILTVNSGDENWNYAMTNSELQDNNSVPKEKGKVAIIDSGVNFSDDVDVYERKNFIPEEEEFLNEDMSVLYEDFSGYRTWVACIIAAKDNGTGISGLKGIKNTNPVATDSSVDSVEGAWIDYDHTEGLVLVMY